MLLTKKPINKNTFTRPLLKWFSENQRDFPWRKTDNPYYILVAELMLQQTGANKVVGSYKQFIKKYPSIFICSKGQNPTMEKIFKPLGLPYRARVIKEISKEIVSKYNRKVPCQKEKLMAIKGIGEYIASAVMVMAFNSNTVVVDTNVRRIFKRLYGNDLKDKEIAQIANGLLPNGKPKCFNLALLDFASLICKHYSPIHDFCPFRDFCSEIQERTGWT